MSIDYKQAAGDPTLLALSGEQEKRQGTEPRTYLGASSIGRPCARSLWYGFRHASVVRFDADTLRRFQDGFMGEDLMADRLRLVPGLTLHTRDPKTGKQYGFVDHAGHVRGHADGMVSGLLQSPKTWHVWEHKQVGDKKFVALDKAKAKHGEKDALKAWDEIYYAQAVIYMHWSKLTRHYLTCTTPGGRKITSVRTHASAKDAKKYLARAKQIVFSPVPPERISNDSSWWECKFCDFQDLCHKKRIADVRCRTCLHATPEADGDGRWSCAWHKIDSIPFHGQLQACDDHRFIPALVPVADAIGADPDKNSVTYRLSSGAEFKNGPVGRGSFASAELVANKDNIEGLLSETSEQFREAFHDPA